EGVILYGNGTFRGFSKRLLAPFREFLVCERCSSVFGGGGLFNALYFFYHFGEEFSGFGVDSYVCDFFERA
ncbi:MAG: hypothetical protein ACTSP1_18530, partial [Candidatus Freyarchaeota archaeon]